jgi:type I restriction enzyme S subunit
MILRDGWKETRLEELAFVDSGQGAPQGEKWYNGNEVFVRAGDLNFLSAGKYVGEYCRRIIPEAVIKYKLKKYKKNSIVFPKSGMSVKTNNIALLKYDSYVVNHLAVLQIRSNDEVLTKYLYYLLKTKELSRLSLNEGYPSIRISDLKQLKLILPPECELERIVYVLEKIEQLKEWRKQSDKLTKDYLISVFLKMFGYPISNPLNWKLMRLSQVGSLARGKSKHRPRNAPELLGGDYPLIQTGDIANCDGYIRNFSQTYSELGLKQSKLWPKGTLCITIAANIALTGILTFDACFPDSVVGFTPKEMIKTEYVQYWLSFLQDMLEATAPKSAQKNINLEILSHLKIPIPPIDLQDRFALVVRKIKLINETQKLSSEQIDYLFNMITQKSFRGE